MSSLPTIAAYPLPAQEDLPANIVAWEVDPARVVLLIHDMQNYFVRPFAPETAQPLVHNIAALREMCTAHSIPVAYTAQPGGMSRPERGLLRDFWGPGMRVSEEERAIVEPLAPMAGDWELTKWRYSAFFRSDLLGTMKAQNRDQLIICGVYAHIGILATALDAYSNDIETFLVADAIADFTADDHTMALNYASKRCASVTLSRPLLDHLADKAFEGGRR